MHDFALASNILADRHFLLHEQMTVSHLGKKISFGQEQEVGTSPLPFPFGDLRGAVALRQITHVHRGLRGVRDLECEWGHISATSWWIASFYPPYES